MWYKAYWECYSQILQITTNTIVNAIAISEFLKIFQLAQIFKSHRMYTIKRIGLVVHSVQNEAQLRIVFLKTYQQCSRNAGKSF